MTMISTAILARHKGAHCSHIYSVYFAHCANKRCEQEENCMKFHVVQINMAAIEQRSHIQKKNSDQEMRMQQHIFFGFQPSEYSLNIYIEVEAHQLNNFFFFFWCQQLCEHFLFLFEKFNFDRILFYVNIFFFFLFFFD